MQRRAGCDNPTLQPACVLAVQLGSGPDAIVLCWQAATIAVSVYLNSEPEHGEASTKALAATLRKRLSLERISVPPFMCKLQVRMKSMPPQDIFCSDSIS